MNQTVWSTTRLLIRYWSDRWYGFSISISTNRYQYGFLVQSRHPNFILSRLIKLLYVVYLKQPIKKINSALLVRFMTKRFISEYSSFGKIFWRDPYHMNYSTDIHMYPVWPQGQGMNCDSVKYVKKAIMAWPYHVLCMHAKLWSAFRASHWIGNQTWIRVHFSNNLKVDQGSFRMHIQQGIRSPLVKDLHWISVHTPGIQHVCVNGNILW